MEDDYRAIDWLKMLGIATLFLIVIAVTLEYITDYKINDIDSRLHRIYINKEIPSIDSTYIDEGWDEYSKPTFRRAD